MREKRARRKVGEPVSEEKELKSRKGLTHTPTMYLVDLNLKANHRNGVGAYYHLVSWLSAVGFEPNQAKTWACKSFAQKEPFQVEEPHKRPPSECLPTLRPPWLPYEEATPLLGRDAKGWARFLQKFGEANPIASIKTENEKQKGL